MTMPIFVCEIESGDVDWFVSEDLAAAYVEPPDIHNYEVFDSDGDAYSISLEGQHPFPSLRPRRVVLKRTGQNAAERLKMHIVRFFASSGHKAELGDLSLAAVLVEFSKHASRRT